MASLLKEGMATGNRREKMINQRWNDGGSYFARTPIIGNLNELLLPPFFIGVGDRPAWHRQWAFSLLLDGLQPG